MAKHILNLIGQEVSKTNIVQEQTRIDVRLLKGCYFMEIREAAKTIKSERFIFRVKRFKKSKDIRTKSVTSRLFVE